MTQLPPKRQKHSGPLLITGASGRVGRLLIPAFRAMGADVVLAHRNPCRLTPDLPELEWDLLNGPEPLLAWTRIHGTPAAMLALAGSTPGVGADMMVNVSLAEACVAAARAAGIPRIMLASSSAVYGYGRDAAWAECDQVDPRSAYGRAKLEMERRVTGADICALRIGNVAGADWVLSNPHSSAVIDRFADGTGPTRSYIGPKTLARVLLELAQTEQGWPPILNIGTSTPVDMAELAQAANFPQERDVAGPEAISRLVLDTQLLESFVQLRDEEASEAELVAQWRACRF